jgi:hypothetical protein
LIDGSEGPIVVLEDPQRSRSEAVQCDMILLSDSIIVECKARSLDDFKSYPSIPRPESPCTYIGGNVPLSLHRIQKAPEPGLYRAM